MSNKPFRFFPHEKGASQNPPAERELKSFFDNQPVAVSSKALESTPVPEEDLKEGLDLIRPAAGQDEDPMLAELIRNHPNNVAKRRNT